MVEKLRAEVAQKQEAAEQEAKAALLKKTAGLLAHPAERATGH